MEAIQHYKPSGKFSPTSFLFFLLLSVTAMPILGLIYSYCIWYIPFIYINFILAGAFGFIAGTLINKFVIKKGKVRNGSLSFLFGLLGGAIALYFHWAVWVDLVINAGESYGSDSVGITVSNISILQVFNLALEPTTLFAIIGEINEYGTWGIRGGSVSGTFLSVIWIIELLIIVGVTLLSSSGQSSAPFCEMSDKWYDENKLTPYLYIDNHQEIIDAITKSDEDYISSLNFAEDLRLDHCIFTLYTSTYSENYLTITNKKAKIEKDDKISYDDEVIIKNVLIDKKTADLFLALNQNVKVAEE